MRNIPLLSVVFASGLSCSSSATAGGYALCFPPRAPTLIAIKPRKPYCAVSRSCSDFEIQSYKRDINRYFDDLQQYLLDVEKFRKLAYEYAQCEAQFD